MVNFCAVCGCCTRTDIVREHLEDTLRIYDVISAMGLLIKQNAKEINACRCPPAGRLHRQRMVYTAWHFGERCGTDELTV